MQQVAIRVYSKTKHLIWNSSNCNFRLIEQSPINGKIFQMDFQNDTYQGYKYVSSVCIKTLFSTCILQYLRHLKLRIFCLG